MEAVADDQPLPRQVCEARSLGLVQKVHRAGGANGVGVRVVGEPDLEAGVVQAQVRTAVADGRSARRSGLRRFLAVLSF